MSDIFLMYSGNLIKNKIKNERKMKLFFNGHYYDIKCVDKDIYEMLDTLIEIYNDIDSDYVAIRERCRSIIEKIISKSIEK